MTWRFAAGVIASIVMTLPLSLLGAACWARFAPFDEQARFVSALLLVVPGWIAASCASSLVRRPVAMLALCLIPCGAFVACLYYA